MKKLVMISLAVIVVLGMSISAIAATGGFIVSPSRNQAPELIEVKPSDDKCTVEVEVTAYADRDTLSPEGRTAIEDAYAKIMGAKNIGELTPAIGDVASGMGADVANFAVSDLFNISASGCESHDGHGKVSVTLGADTLANFACVIAYNNGEWSVIEGATVSEDGKTVTFEADKFGPVAFVANTGSVSADVEEPLGEDNVATTVSVSVATGAAVLAAPMAYFMVQFKKKKISFK